MGRGPLDEEAIRLLEAQNPDLEFDWTRILKGQPSSEAQGERRAEGRGEERRSVPRGHSERERYRPRRQPRAAEALLDTIGAPGDPAVRVEQEKAPDVAEEVPTSAAHARLGTQGLTRLRARYSEMLARINDRVSDLARQDELKSLAERLNPDGWVTEADVNAALESYESTFAALRAEFIPARPAPPSAQAGDDERSV